ncbi:hypothetical protein CDD80_1593 [Ophiocordyceps camponoti-rufipedis]|uniref:Uncharacterized protein n=1 Tax=Ophiocordyceps camponoti-rufipedis TaxID=2004952 RepID=A0A2C5XYL1_9HYPO|nr:hypothetical protein CDD80_1593 [Ophiocordyceps camponoti-rufipedis]
MFSPSITQQILMASLPRDQVQPPPSDRDKPSPLRIIKQSRPTSPLPTLRVAKRRGGQELSRGGRLWGDALTRCRGLLARSTPSFREVWRQGSSTSSHHRSSVSGCRGGWSDSDSEGGMNVRPVSSTATTVMEGAPFVLCPFVSVVDCFFEYGCLYDLGVAVEATGEATVVRVIQEQAFPTTIYAGSSVLLLAQIALKTKPQPRHTRQKSDELIEHLELQLGASATPQPATLLHVRVSYSHSAFPEQQLSSTTDKAAGVVSLRSRMETVAGADLAGGAEGRVLDVVGRHWGEERACAIAEMMGGWVFYTSRCRRRG